MSDFYSKLQTTLDNVSITENGAVGYKTTEHALADFNYKISSYRSNITNAINDFNAVLREKDQYALKYLFYLRDVREGIGERDLFRVVMQELLKASFENKDEIINTIIEKIPEFGRWDDMFLFIGTKYENKALEALKQQFKEDFKNYQGNKPISLLAKWLPSENASAKSTKELARKLIKAFGATPKTYRKTLSALRAYLDVTEVKTCAKDWGDIDYNTVPSKANVKYAKAFLRNDETRRRQYLADLNRGTDKDGNVVKINSKANTPHDVLHMYSSGNWYSGVKPYDETVEQLWKNLKDIEGLKNTIVVRDDSGSMTSSIGNTNVTAYEVATALSIYCAEHNSDAYKNKVITFSETPRYLDFSDARSFGSLHSKYDFLTQHSEVANTNIEAVFDLILKTAVENNLKAEDLPEQILILSDMEFDAATRGAWYSKPMPAVTASLFSTIADKYNQHGYKLPKLIFWNLNSRTGTIPCKQNEAGVILISGFSQNVLSLVNSRKTDPYEVLIDELNKERYKDIPLIAFTGVAKKEQTYKATKKAKSTTKEETPDFLK